MNVKRFIHIWTIAILFLLLDVNVAKAASSCPLDSVLTYDINSVLTEVTIYDAVEDTSRTTVWTVNPNGTRVGKSREESYSSSLKTMTASYEWDNSTHNWKGTDKKEYVYKYFAGKKKQISETTFKWINAKWVADQRKTNNYDDAAREIEYFEYNRNTTTNQLQPISGYRYEWIDDTQKSMEEIHTSYSNGVLTAGTKKEWAFDDEGHQTMYAYYSTVVGGKFVGDSKEEWGFTDNVQTMHATYVWADVEWAGVLKEVLVNDSLGRATLHETYDWYNSDWSMTLREIAAFDEAGHQILIENYTGENGVPTGTQKEEYAYSGDTLILSIVYKWSASKINWIGSTYEKWEYNGPTGEKTYYEKQVWRNSAWGDSIQEIWEFNGPSNQQTLHEKYVWNKDAASLLPNLEYTDEYDSDDHLIRKEYYTFTNGVRVGKTYYTYTYENGKKTAYTVYAWENGAWVGDKNEIWEFNGPSNKQTKHEKFVWENDEWTTTLLEITSYTGSYATLKEKYELVNGVLIGTEKEIYSYNGSKKIESIVYKWVNNAWVEDTKDTWDPSSTKPTLHEQFTWNGEWVKILQENTTYSGSNKTLVENYALIEGVWTGTEKETWAYSGSQLTKHEQFAWEGDWVKTLEENTTYDGSNITAIENYALLEGVWTGTKREEYTYDGSTKTLELIYQWYNNAWMYQTKEEWAFDSGHQTLHEKDGWNGAEWIPMQREVAAFDAEGNQTLVENYVLYTTGWTGIKKEEYTFEGSIQTSAVIYRWNTDDWIPFTKSESGYTDGNTEVSATNYIWNVNTWTGIGNRTFTTYDEANRVTEMIAQNWPAGATEWTNYTLTQNTYNTDGVNVLMYNANWDGVQWVMSSMQRTDIIIDDEDRQLLHASWQCGANGVWTGIQKDTAAYSGTGMLLYMAHYNGWKNNDWIPATMTHYVYDSEDRVLLKESYVGANNNWKGTFKYEYTYDDQGRQTSYARYNSWNTSTNSWVGDTKQEYVYYKNYKDKYVSTKSYSWSDNTWTPLFFDTYTYDDSLDREVEHITQSYFNGIWENTNKYVKGYDENKLVKEETYAWSKGQWALRSQSIKSYDDDAQAKLRHEIEGKWKSKGLVSYEDKYYSYACDPMTIRFVNYDGALLEEQTVYKGDLPVYSGETPTKSDAANTYVFLGWSPAVVPANGNATYTATYSSSLNQYTVTFKNDDGTVLSNQTLYHGATPTCAEPSKTADAEYTYTFAGWTPEVTTVSADITYTAIYSATKNKYTITWRDDDNSLIDATEVAYGVVPTHANPSKQATKEYSYTFAGWSPQVVSVTGDATYTATYTGTKKSYTITWLNSDNTSLGTTTVEYGVVPTPVNVPDKTNTAQYTYTFAGWTPEVAAVKGDATYKASFIESINQYTITFKDDQGNILDSRLWDYGLTPYCAIPTKEPDEQYNYPFTGWSPKVTAVTKEATYTATFTPAEKTYTITWLNDDNSQIDQTEVAYGVVPTHDNPTKAATAEWTYTFAGWDSTPVAVTGEAIYKATYTSTKNQYTITWLDSDNSQIGQTTVEYGVMPTHDDPTKAATAQYTYTFNGWTPSLVAVIGNATYTASYTETVNQYTVIFKDDLGNTLDSRLWDYGATPTCTDPTKAPDEQNTYVFAGWSPQVASVTENTTYTAVFTSIKNQYTITWLDDNNAQIDQTTVEYGVKPTHDDPTKAATAEYTYTFAGWSPAVVIATADVSYTASYSATKNKYTITWLNDDNTQIDQTSVEYGVVPTHDDPTKAATAEFTYTFAGWNNTPIAVTGEATYKATYTSSKNSYTITWLNDDDTQIDQTSVEYGVVPTHDDPAKQATAEFTYTFTGWDNTPIAVVGEATYKATYTSAKNSYTITWLDEDDSSLGTSTVEYGIVPTHEDPTRQPTAQYGYTFAGWSPAISAVTGNATYKAMYTDTINQYTISWLDDIGTLVDQTKVAYGATPAHANIYKESDSQYDYTFVGWTPTLVPVTGDASYSAIFTTAGKSYTVTFYFEDGVTILDQMTLPYGAIPSTPYIPSIPSDANHTYTFSGWSPEIAPVTGDISYVPTFTAIPNQYTVIFRNYNGKELQRKKVDYGTIPEYEGDEPSRPATNSYTWAFEGWTPELTAVIGDATYTAVYTKVMNTYTILFYDEDGTTLLDEVTVEHGQKPTTSVIPTKEADEEYRYTFAGWSPKIAKATSDAEYTATYFATPKTQGLNNTEAEERATKVLIDDHIYILRAGHTYTLDGMLVE